MGVDDVVHGAAARPLECAGAGLPVAPECGRERGTADGRGRLHVVGGERRGAARALHGGLLPGRAGRPLAIIARRGGQGARGASGAAGTASASPLASGGRSEAVGAASGRISPAGGGGVGPGRATTPPACSTPFWFTRPTASTRSPRWMASSDAGLPALRITARGRTWTRTTSPDGVRTRRNAPRVPITRPSTRWRCGGRAWSAAGPPTAAAGGAVSASGAASAATRAPVAVPAT